MVKSIKENEKVMNEKCLCECGKNTKIIKHFELCEVCGSSAYHSTPFKLNPEVEARHRNISVEELIEIKLEEDKDLDNGDIESAESIEIDDE